jgi:hypothetical protein
LQENRQAADERGGVANGGAEWASASAPERARVAAGSLSETLSREAQSAVLDAFLALADPAATVRVVAQLVHPCR